MRKLIAVLCISCVIGGCASSTVSPDIISNTNVVRANDIEKRRGAPPDGTAERAGYICQTERPVGTRFGRKVCRTAAQIAADREASRQSLPSHRDCAVSPYMCKE